MIFGFNKIVSYIIVLNSEELNRINDMKLSELVGKAIKIFPSIHSICLYECKYICTIPQDDNNVVNSQEQTLVIQYHMEEDEIFIGSYYVQEVMDNNYNFLLYIYSMAESNSKMATPGIIS